jgi:hypothetical protein
LVGDNENFSEQFVKKKNKNQKIIKKTFKYLIDYMKNNRKYLKNKI